MRKKLEVKFITAHSETDLENALRLFAKSNLDIEIKNTSHVVSHDEGVYGPGKTERHYYTIWYTELKLFHSQPT